MVKFISFFIMIVIAINNLSLIRFDEAIGQDELVQALKAQAPVIGLATACSLPLEIMKRIMGEQNAVTSGKQSKPQKERNSKKQRNSDFILISGDDRIYISRILQDGSIFYGNWFTVAAAAHQFLNIRGQPRGKPLEKHRNYIFVFMLGYIILLAMSNLPYSAFGKVLSQNKTRS